MSTFRVLFVCAAFGAVGAHATTVTDPVEIQGDFLHVSVDPREGGAVTLFSHAALPGNLAGEDGMLLEGFGVGSYYIPNRRLNERLEIVAERANRPQLRYTYDCDGPNIRGLRVTRLMEPMPDEASMRVTWTIENRGDERQWMAPWLRNDLRPGGAIGDRDRLDAPTLAGVIPIDGARYHAAARNWVAATDPVERVSWYAVFNADHTHSFLGLREDGVRAFQTAFAPRLIEPGEKWETTYRLNVVRGLTKVDFATDEFAAQIDYRNGELTLLLSAVKAMPDLEIHARVLAPSGRLWRLPTKRFSIDPNRMVRATYDWDPPGDGAYEFLAQVTRHDEPVLLGQDTRSPHGGIDTQFVVGAPSNVEFEAWSDGPYLLERGERTRPGPIAARNDRMTAWFESSLEKVFRSDRPETGAPRRPSYALGLARGERKSFQVAVRPPEDGALLNARFAWGDFTHENGRDRIGADHLSAYLVQYHPIRVPSHFEGPTGQWPDALRPLAPFLAEGGETQPVWFTLYAPRGAAPGRYRGTLELRAEAMEPVEFEVEARVYAFALPETPHLKTDFGFRMDVAMNAAGSNRDETRIREAYLDEAMRHRVTLRELAALPRESADYDASLRQFRERLDRLRAGGATTFAVPHTLLDAPEQLRKANAFVREHGLSDRAFVHLAHEPAEPAWPRLLETMQRWKDNAPDIPVLVTTMGLQPFLSEALDWWGVHAQLFDTTHNRAILNRAAGGEEVWWYFNHAPPRPYGNFFVDFAAIEHRILFWQAWALGVRGMHYWSVNHVEPGADPFTDGLLDITPVNGDGLLLYPGPNGPIGSIRWETIRDGVTDYDYLAMLMERRRRLEARGGHEALQRQAAEAYNLESIAPSLVTYPRDPEALRAKRAEIAEAIEALDRALGN